MVHQNFIKTIVENTNKHLNKYELANSIATSIAKGDVIENYIYGDQNWNLQEVHGYYSCVYPSYVLSNNLSKNGMYENFIFPLDLNRTSIKRINKKNVIQQLNDDYFLDVTIIIGKDYYKLKPLK